jgi:hypothetical protein
MKSGLIWIFLFGVTSIFAAPGPVKIAISPKAPADFENAKLAAIVMNGADLFRTKVMEDALALELLKNGRQIVSRTRMETLIIERLSGAPPASPAKEPLDAPNPGQALPAPSVVRSQSEPVGASQIAKAAGAQIVFIGNMVEERQRSLPLTTGKPVLDQPMMVTALSLQVLNVETESAIMILVGEWPLGISISDAAADLANAMREAVRPLRIEESSK